jgi:hypothetical protein
MAETADINVKITDTEEFKRGLEIARGEGLKEGRLELIDWLKGRYLVDEDRPDRGTPEAQAILTLAGEALKHLQLLDTPTDD